MSLDLLKSAAFAQYQRPRRKVTLMIPLLVLDQPCLVRQNQSCPCPIGLVCLPDPSSHRFGYQISYTKPC
jgi:hypothetical protein